ncbi:MAG: urea carboxylase [Endomicrobium sp.]|jgi:urea carboxylase|nr:urea carboxylase [Endomicrobium sp.]
MFKKVLIANRGIIAARIERTLKKMGVKSVALYTKADIDSLHVQNADEAVCIGEGNVKESYLNAELILKTAIETQCEAVHPGYGFLSENADFAQECENSGIKFIGPLPRQIREFGLKHRAREIAKKAGVSILEGSGLIDNVETAQSQALKIGYPVMLKSTAGGGGIGMRVCRCESELAENFLAVSRLAASNFKDGGVFIEKYIANARHIEVQIFGSRSGQIITLGERDCSVQRRNQKVVEESPAPKISEETRRNMLAAAKALAKEARYENAGTVEFLYDGDTEEFYFLEVNARLQVEHAITEEVCGADLVEMMVKEAAGELGIIEDKVPQGVSIEARIYAEDPLRDFCPSSGKITKIILPDNSCIENCALGNVRVETWLQDNIAVSPLYDPMLAKIIVKGKDREAARENLEKALMQTKIYGVATNINYLLSLIKQDYYKNAYLNASMLKNFSPQENALEVIDAGVQTSAQDYPGIVGYWGVGVPPCGAMDMFSFRLGNKILGNPDDACGLELTLRGGTYKFRSAAVFCITGADMDAKLDGKPVKMYEALRADTGQILEFCETQKGMRTYLLVKGGFDIAAVLNSKSTFILGKFGGHSGRALRNGDVIGINETASKHIKRLLFKPEPFRNEWIIGVIPGPHCDEEFLKNSFLDTFIKTKWKIHFNSSRTGVRLIGPAPQWARSDGGQAGLHPSNIHDTAYSVGALDLTGDMPILLGPDGPSLGGFVCPVTTASAELWKLGQLKPNDKVMFKLLTLEEARYLKDRQELFLSDIEKHNVNNVINSAIHTPHSILPQNYPVLFRENGARLFTVRCAGDRYLLIEYGEMVLDISLRFKVHSLMSVLSSSGLPIIEMTPGVRSLQIHFDINKISLKDALKKVIELENYLGDKTDFEVPSRIVKMPLSWDDPQIRLAVERYHKNVRPDAPWCPSNIEFIRRINGLESEDEVKKIIFNASYLVLGLGDVYLGAPLTVAVDPRHRLVTTKYNPARTWTPENAVGIGGAYMGIYGMEGPGGYQLFGRTIQVWNALQRDTKTFSKQKPWSLDFFDQIRFFPVSARELLELREDFLRGKYELEIEQSAFNLKEHLLWLDEIKGETDVFENKRKAAFEAEKLRWKEQGLDKFVSETDIAETSEEIIPKGASAVRASMTGVVWKIAVYAGQEVKKGDAVIIEESMKMELSQIAPKNGIVEKICVLAGQQVNAGQVLAIIK